MNKGQEKTTGNLQQSNKKPKTSVVVDSASVDMEDLNVSNQSSNSLQSPPHKKPAAAMASTSVVQELAVPPHPVIFHLTDGKGNFWHLSKV